MTIEEGPDLSNLTTHHHQQHHLLDWLEDSATFLPSFLDEPYTIPIEITGYENWWTTDLDQSHLIHTPAISTTPAEQTTTSIESPKPPQPESTKKRKQTANPTVTHQNRRRVSAETTDEDEDEVQRKPGNGRKAGGKGGGGGSGNGGSKEVRWAEQLLNHCTAAMDTGNVSRVQHLLYVLHELASPSGDANHRLAAHGIRALAHHLPTSVPGIGIPGTPVAHSFGSSEPSLFRSALIRFNEVSPWFAFPNSLANSSILHAAEPSQRPKGLHVVDIGVSHGVQWPTLLEALTRRPGGAPAQVRLTVAGTGAVAAAPFSDSPPGYDFTSHLLRYGKSIDLNLRIDRAESLSAEAISIDAGETLVVCIQFRGGDGGSLLRSVRDLDPDLVVVSEIEGGSDGGGFGAGFKRRAEVVWGFMDSTSSAFKGRDCGERRLMEGEAARILENEAAAAEGRERWRETIAGAGFGEVGFREEALEAGRALLRKYDGNWEMRAETVAAAVRLCWKGRAVSFCSLWKPLKKEGS